MSKKTASLATINARFAADELTRRAAIIDSIAWSVWTGNRNAIENMMAFCARRNSTAVDVFCINRMADGFGGSALLFWQRFKKCRHSDGLDATRANIHKELHAVWKEETAQRKLAREAAKLAAEDAVRPALTASPTPVSQRDTSREKALEARIAELEKQRAAMLASIVTPAVVDSTCVEVKETLALDAPYSKPQIKIINPAVIAAHRTDARGRTMRSKA